MNGGLIIRLLLRMAIGSAVMCGASVAQGETILESSSRSFTIIDDGDRRPATLVDDLPVDTYVYHPGATTKRITVITDQGEQRFEFERGKVIDFDIRFNGRIYPQRFAPVEPHVWSGPEELTLPFRLNRNNGVVVTAAINGSRPLQLLFDTGASVSVLNQTDAEHGAKLSGPTGEIQLGPVRVGKTPIISIRYDDTLKADGVLGYNVFLGRQVTIDYGRRELRVGLAGGAPPAGFRTVPLIWRGGHSLVAVDIADCQTTRTLPMVLDTGSKYAVSLSNRYHRTMQSGQLETYGWRIGTRSDGTRVYSRVFDLPSVSLAGFTLPHVQAEVERQASSSTLDVDILGNDFLKRFDLIIDYQSGQLHLRPNGLRSVPYNTVGLSDSTVLVVGVTLVSILAGLFLLLLRKQRSRNLKK